MILKKRQEIRFKVCSKRKDKINTRYLDILDLLDEIDMEGVETIYSLFDVYILSYDNINENNELFLEKVDIGKS